MRGAVRRLSGVTGEFLDQQCIAQDAPDKQQAIQGALFVRDHIVHGAARVATRAVAGNGGGEGVALGGVPVELHRRACLCRSHAWILADASAAVVVNGANKLGPDSYTLHLTASRAAAE
jgi:hypothetical protein